MTKNKLVILFFFLLLAGVGAQADNRDRGDQCLPTRCGDEGPEIRYPFWLKDHQPDRCGYGPDFALTCSPTNNETMLDNPFSVKVVVKDINYPCQFIWYKLSGDYAPHQKNLSLIFDSSVFSPFQLLSNIVPEFFMFSCRSSKYPYKALCEYSVFSCLSSLEVSYNIYELPCLSRQGQNLYLLSSDYLIRRNLLKNCKKIDTIPSIPCLHQERYNYGCPWGGSAWSETIPSCQNLHRQWHNYIYGPSYGCSWRRPAWSEPNCGCSWGGSAWSEPNCRKCEEQGKNCRLRSSNNSKKHETECFGIIRQSQIDIPNYMPVMPPRGTSHPSEEKEEYLLHFPRALILFVSSIN